MISSLSNPRIKKLRLLKKPRERKAQNLFVIEGLLEIEKARKANYQFESVFYCSEIVSSEDVSQLIQPAEAEVMEVSRKVYDQIAYREGAGGLIVCAVPQSKDLNDLQLSATPLVLVLESVEKPGNLGAVLRTADAAGVDAVIVCDPQTDLYNPNVVRSSIGCLFTVPTVATDSQSAITWLSQSKIKIHCAALSASRSYLDADFKQPTAIVMGTESTGLSDIWLDQSDQNIIIPMRGVADSMNVSTSAAVILFEAIRQRSI